MVEMPARSTLVSLVAVSAIGLVALLGAMAFVLGPTDDCPPLGNGGAMPIAETGGEVDTKADALALLRSEIGHERNVSTGGSGHLYGSDQIHRHVGGVPHYHFSPMPGAGSGVTGWVVTENGTTYRVVQGAC